MKRLLFVVVLITLVGTCIPVSLAEGPERYYVRSDYTLYGQVSGTFDDLRYDDGAEWSLTEKRYRKDRAGKRVPAYDAFDERLIFEEGSWGDDLVLCIDAWHEDGGDPDEIIVQWRYQFGPVIEGTLDLKFGSEPGPVQCIGLPHIEYNFQIMFVDSYRGPLVKGGLDGLHIDQMYLERKGVAPAE